jgi:hypothetical protein
MRTFLALALVIAGFPAIDLASANSRAEPRVDFRLAQANSGRVCAQVMSCGTKDGKRKQYPTPCAAQDDGATNIKPMTGSTCDDSK